MKASVLPRAFRVSVCLFICAVSTAGAVLIHNYEFNNSLADSLGGPSLVAASGTFTPAGFEFDDNVGLSLSGGVTSNSVYTISLSFQFDDPVNYYNRILDFKNHATDNGLYRGPSSMNGALRFYRPEGGSMSGNTTLTGGEMFRVTVTRDALGIFKAYVNGTAQMTFNDSATQDAVFSGVNNIIWFFQDDGSEASPGVVNQILIYNTALSDAEVLALGGPKPIPEISVVIGVPTLVGVAIFVLRRRRGCSGPRVPTAV